MNVISNTVKLETCNWFESHKFRLVHDYIIVYSICGSLESGSLESGSLESGSLESGSLESGSLASGSLESGSLESGSLESGSLESGSLESGSLESGSLESGSLESGSLESGSLESGSLESGSLDNFGTKSWVLYTPSVMNILIPACHFSTLAYRNLILLLEVRVMLERPQYSRQFPNLSYRTGRTTRCTTLQTITSKESFVTITLSSRCGIVHWLIARPNSEGSMEAVVDPVGSIDQWWIQWDPSTSGGSSGIHQPVVDPVGSIDQWWIKWGTWIKRGQCYALKKSLYFSKSSVIQHCCVVI